MEVKLLKPDHFSGEILFENYLVKGFDSFDQLIDLYAKYKKNNSKKSILITLDKLDQAHYTSTHAILNNDLDSTEGYDLSGIDAIAFENNEHIGYLSTPSEFFIRKENFLKQTQNIDFSEACKRGLLIDANELKLLEEINNNPIDFLDNQIIVKIIPVEKTYESICGFPNGYFNCDLNPFENYALAKHLHKKYDYQLFGIGASLIGFLRDSPLKEKQAIELSADLAKLYNSEEHIFQNLIHCLKDTKHLFLKYTENLDL